MEDPRGRTSLLLIWGCALNIVWFFLLLPAWASRSLPPVTQIPFEKTPRYAALGRFIPNLWHPGVFERDRRERNVRYHLILQSDQVADRVREKLDELYDPEGDWLNQVLRFYFLEPGKRWEAEGRYALARTYFKRGFGLAHSIASEHDLVSAFAFQRSFSELRLRYSFHQSHIATLEGAVQDSLFPFQSEELGMDLCSYGPWELQYFAEDLASQTYPRRRIYGMALSLFREVRQSFFWYAYDEMTTEQRIEAHECSAVAKELAGKLLQNRNSELRSEALYLLGRIQRMEKAIGEAETTFLRLTEEDPYSYLADDALLALFSMCAGEPACTSPPEEYRRMLLQRYRDRDAARYFD